jgi:hypothetical protein
MSPKRDIASNLILIMIVIIILGLGFYLFFYSGSQPSSSPKIQTPDESPISVPESPSETKYKGKNVYIIDPRAKIRSEPKSGATVVDEKKRCEILTVTGAMGDWFEVDFDFGTKGWILREQVSDRNPCQKKVEKPPKTIETEDNQENIQALDQLRGDLDNLMAFINQRALQQFAQEIVTGFEIRDGGSKLTLYISNLWQILPPVQKEIMFNLVAYRYARQTCMLRIRTECSTDDFPTINFLNPENREVARMAANQPLIIFE